MIQQISTRMEINPEKVSQDIKAVLVSLPKITGKGAANLTPEAEKDLGQSRIRGG